MGRTEAKSGQAAKRPMAATSEASLPRSVSVLSIVADLEGPDLDGLRRQWRAHLGGEAPAHLPRWLLMRVLTYRLQFALLIEYPVAEWKRVFDVNVNGLFYCNRFVACLMKAQGYGRIVNISSVAGKEGNPTACWLEPRMFVQHRGGLRPIGRRTTY